MSALEAITTDENTASARYFAPVIRSINDRIENATDDASCAEGIADVMAKAVFYLKNRGNRWFDTRRRNRRNACERIVSEIGRFLQDAPAVYAEKIRDTIESKRKQNHNLRH